MPSINESFVVNHTCLRIKDPKVSVPFYVENFGMKLVDTFRFPDLKFTLYMLGFEHDEATAGKNWSAREGILELCHNHGSEDDDSYQLNHGNGTEHRGFGHICFSVDNIEVLESKLLNNGVKFQKKLSDGRQKDIAFALDPNGYWIELIEHAVGKTASVTNTSTYAFNHTMIRVKDPVKSLEFYQKVLGLKLFGKYDFPAAKFTLYFLGYDHENAFVEGENADKKLRATEQGLIELTHNWGTESDPEFKGYHNGNSTENGAIQGFGHTCVSCSDPVKLCSEIEKEFPNADWSLKWGAGGIKEIAFIRDPDGYSVEIIGDDLFENGNGY